MKTRLMNGSSPIPETSSDAKSLQRLKDLSTHSIELSDAKYAQYTSSKYFTETRVKTAAEIAETEKEGARQAAESNRDDKFNKLDRRIRLLKERIEDMEILGLTSIKIANGDVNTYSLAQIKARLKTLVTERYEAHTDYISSLEAL